VSLLGGGKSPFHDDDGSADPEAAAALAAFGSGGGSEHAALTALAASRLLVPIVATPGESAGGGPGAGPGAGAGGGGDHGAEMSLPALIGRDGRPAIPAFTCMEALARWDPQARPVPAPAGQVWRAAVDSSSAVVVDVAGPVPLVIEGARLAALAAGQPVPPPHQDPDVLAAVRAAAGGQPAIAVRVGPGSGPAPWDQTARDAAGAGANAGANARGDAADGGSDLQIEVTLADGCDAEAGEAAARLLGSVLMDQLGARLRRGITIAVTPPDGHPGS
jgi:SseB protein N-terminal domain